MARHRALVTRVRRGMAKWPVAITGLVVLLLLGWVAWTWLGGVLERRAAAEANDCSNGSVVLRVAVTPSIAEPVREAAQRWTDTTPVIDDACIRPEVQSVDSSTVLTGLTAKWDDSKLGAPPAAWLPDSTLWANRLTAQNNAIVGAAPQSIATSPVVLATQQPGADALASGNLVRWTDLPALTSAANGWAGYGKPQWGKFRLAVPDPATNPASALAIQSALAGATAQGAGPVTTDMLAQQGVKDLITKLANSRASGAPAGTLDALDGLARAADIGTASYSAVPVTEVDLYRRNLGKDGAPKPAKPLYEVGMGGASPAADFPFVTLSGSWVSQTQNKAAQQFRDFVRQPAQQKLFAAAGLRVAATPDHPTDSVGMRWPALTQNLVPADATTTQDISASWTAAAVGDEVLSVLVDTSPAMGPSGVEAVRGALTGEVNRAVSGSMGLWAYAAGLDGDKPYKQLVPVVRIDQSIDQLHAGITKLAPATGSQLYASMLAVYQSVLAHYQDGKHNRVVVVVAGRNDGGLTFDQLRTQLGQLKDAKRPVPVNIIAVGTNIDHDQLSAIAQDTGGSLASVHSGDGVDAALAQLLSTTN
ncbi:substrate-binding domain-containing protein [Kutzneria sp. NPDC052558]|uniref:substrate-binding domain-containing protein n=1 Tax=Kutzneria sp. NPDC052558 TaxID=3364121 RepID=UPI0037C82440